MDEQPMKILVWNVRGLNSPARRTTIAQIVMAANPSVVCFQETKMEIVTLDIVKHCLGNKFETFYYLPAVGTRRGILLAWDATMVAPSHPHYTQNTLTALVKPRVGQEWWITGVYGPQLDGDKIVFLQEIVDVRDLQAGPWMLLGDFNLLVNPEDKSNNAINRRMMARFRAKLNLLELKELYLNRRRYTWSNERAEATLEKIDHVFCRNSWEDLYPTCCLSALGSTISDHCPMLLEMNADLAIGRRFKFEAFWTKAEGFMEQVSEVWASIPSVGNPYVVLDAKLRATVKALKKWSDKWIGSIKMQISIVTPST